MRPTDIWFLGVNVWLAALYVRLDGPTWIAILAAMFWLAGMIYIKTRTGR